MKITSGHHPSQIARLYGAAQATRPAPAKTPDSAGRIESVNQTERTLNTRAARLVAGVVPGGIDFHETGQATPSASTLQMYRHPADRNVAATQQQVGQRVDLTG